MSFDPDISVMALVQVLQRLRFVQTLRVDMPSLERAWLSTGLRQSDLPVSIKDLETAGFITVCDEGAGMYLVPGARHAHRRKREPPPDFEHLSWMDGATLYWIKLRRRGKGVGVRRRRTDQIQRLI